MTHRQPVPVRVRAGDGSLLDGETGPGESWYGAATRLLAERGHPADVPDALDLSGGVKLFGCDRDSHIGFRRMTRADLPAMVAWQAEPHVSRWWDGDTGDVAGGRAQVRRPDRRHRPDPALGPRGQRALGRWVQDYRIGDHPDYALLTGSPDAVGLDYAIGAPAFVGRGIGTRALWVYLRDVVRGGYPDAGEFFAAPDHRNAASLRVLDKLGFARGLWFDEPQRDGRVDTVVGCSLEVRRVLGWH